MVVDENNIKTKTETFFAEPDVEAQEGDALLSQPDIGSILNPKNENVKVTNNFAAQYVKVFVSVIK